MFECPITLERFQDPVTLSCQHTFECGVIERVKSCPFRCESKDEDKDLLTDEHVVFDMREPEAFIPWASAMVIATETWNHPTKRRFFIWAAELEHRGALFSLGGLFHWMGRSVPVNCDEAFRYFLLAATRGCLLSQENLVLMFVRGEASNEEEAVFWFRQCAANEKLDGHIAHQVAMQFSAKWRVRLRRINPLISSCSKKRTQRAQTVPMTTDPARSKIRRLLCTSTERRSGWATQVPRTNAKRSSGLHKPKKRRQGPASG